jgi:hypothetical protein
MQIENTFVPFTSPNRIAMSGIFFSLRQDLRSVTEKKNCPNVLKNYGLLLSKYMQSSRGKIDHLVSRSKMASCATYATLQIFCDEAGKGAGWNRDGIVQDGSRPLFRPRK